MGTGPPGGGQAEYVVEHVGHEDGGWVGLMEEERGLGMAVVGV